MLLLGLQQLCSSCWLLHLLWNNNKAFVFQFGRANKKKIIVGCVWFILESEGAMLSAKSMAASSHFKSIFSVGVEGAGLKKYIFAPVRSCVFLLFPSEGLQILISFERACNHFRCIFFILNWSFIFSLTSWRPLPGVFLLDFPCIIDLHAYSTGFTGDDTLGSLRSRTAGRLRTAEWGKMSRKIGNAQSPATFFRHSAVLSLPATLLRKLPLMDRFGPRFANMGCFSKTTRTSLDYSARSTNTQIWLN